MSDPRRGAVWGARDDVGRRPFLVMTRTAAIPVLNNVLAAPVTLTVRSIPSESPLVTVPAAALAL